MASIYNDKHLAWLERNNGAAMQAFNQITLSDIASLTGQCDKIIIEKSNKHLPEVDDAWKLIRNFELAYELKRLY